MILLSGRSMVVYMFYAGVHGRKYIFQLWQKRPTELPFRRRVIHRFCCHTLALSSWGWSRQVIPFAAEAVLRKRKATKVAKDMDRKGLDVRSLSVGEWKVTRWISLVAAEAARPNLNHRWANSLAPFLSPPDDCLLELPPSIHAYTSTPRCASPRGPAVLPSPLPQEQ